jgi:hypothetical protein
VVFPEPRSWPWTSSPPPWQQRPPSGSSLREGMAPRLRVSAYFCAAPLDSANPLLHASS